MIVHITFTHAGLSEGGSAHFPEGGGAHLRLCAQSLLVQHERRHDLQRPHAIRDVWPLCVLLSRHCKQCIVYGSYIHRVSDLRCHGHVYLHPCTYFGLV